MNSPIQLAIHGASGRNGKRLVALGSADPGIKIKGHSIAVPGFGTIYLGEMTISPVQRRIHMVRIELGCPDGGGAMMLTGCPGYHEFP